MELKILIPLNSYQIPIADLNAHFDHRSRGGTGGGILTRNSRIVRMTGENKIRTSIKMTRGKKVRRMNLGQMNLRRMDIRRINLRTLHHLRRRPQKPSTPSPPPTTPKRSLGLVGCVKMVSLKIVSPLKRLQIAIRGCCRARESKFAATQLITSTRLWWRWGRRKEKK